MDSIRSMVSWRVRLWGGIGGLVVVVAGGLGITINERIGWRDYESLGMVLLTLFVVVAFIEFFSAYLRKKLS